jgi:hypothetical protein
LSRTLGLILSNSADIVGWLVSSAGNTMEWMAEVETADSIGDAETPSKWKKTMLRGTPFYLLIPRGLKESAQKLAGDAAVPVSGIYEYTL